MTQQTVLSTTTTGQGAYACVRCAKCEGTGGLFGPQDGYRGRAGHRDFECPDCNGWGDVFRDIDPNEKGSK